MHVRNLCEFVKMSFLINSIYALATYGVIKVYAVQIYAIGTRLA